MPDLQPAALIATVSKHDIGGIVAIVIGAIVIVLGVAKLAARTAMAFLLPLVGVVVVVIGILLFTRTI
jgi:hypothetical protein